MRNVTAQNEKNVEMKMSTGVTSPNRALHLGDFWAGLIGGAIPFAVIGVLAVTGVALPWWLVLALPAATLVAALGYGAWGKNELAAGVLVALAAAILTGFLVVAFSGM